MPRNLAILLVLVLTAGILRAQLAPATSPAACWQASITAETSKDYDTALSQLLAYQAAGGDPFLTNLRGGWLYYLKQDYKNAGKCYAQAAQLQPTAINPLLGLLNVAQAQGVSADIDRAVNDILRVDPLNYRAQMAQAESLFKLKSYTQALASYRRVLTCYPDDLYARSGEAWSLYYIGDTKNASADFQLLLSINTEYPYAQQGLGLCLKSGMH